MNSFLPIFDQHTVLMSVAELNELHEDLYSLQMAAGANWAIQDKVLRMLAKIEMYLEEAADEPENDPEMGHDAHLVELPMLMEQAQMQCQQ